MRRKVFRDFANTHPAMLVGWRMQEDLELLAELPSGILTIDVLHGTGSHSQVPAVSLHIARELQAWLAHRMNELHIPMEVLSQVTIVAEINTDRIATNRKRIVSFNFNCKSALVSGDHCYVGGLVEKHVWHSRITA